MLWREREVWKFFGFVVVLRWLHYCTYRGGEDLMRTAADQKTFTYFGVMELERVSIVLACGRRQMHRRD